MNGIIILIGITLFLAVSSFVSSSGKLIDDRSKGIKKIKRKGWFIISLNLCIVILSVLQYFFKEGEIKQKEKEAQTNQAKRDSALKSNYDSSLYVLKSKFDTSTINIVSTISQKLGEYGFRLDSTGKRLEKVMKDSAKLKILSQEDPVLEICAQDGIKLVKTNTGDYKFAISICSTDASSTGFNLRIFFIFADSLNNFYKVKNTSSLSDKLQISKDASSIYYYGPIPKIDYRMLFVYILGTYKNMERTKTFNIDQIAYYNKVGNSSGYIIGETRKKIINYINQNITKFDPAVE
jgi:hypothetical protein